MTPPRKSKERERKPLTYSGARHDPTRPLVWLVWPVGCEPRPLVALVLGLIALSLVAGPDPVALFARAFVHGLR